MASNSLKNDKEYINELFGSSKFYNIPEYQRSYVWSKQNVWTLLDDVATAMEQNDQREYFLGCIILNAKKETKGNVSYESFDLLDGQQRFITLYLLQAVIKDLAQNSQLKHGLIRNLCQEQDIFKNTPERNRIEFSIRKDAEFINEFVVKQNGTIQFEAIKEFAVSQSTYGTSVKRMAQALLDTHEWWAEKRASYPVESAFQEYLQKFAIYLGNKVLILYLATSDNLDDAYNLFTVLNSRGVKLEAGDILRAQNLRGIKDENKKLQLAAKWDEYASVATDGIYRNFDEFLWMLVHVVMKYTSEANKSLSKAFDFMDKQGSLTKGTSTIDFIGKYIQHLLAVTEKEFQQKEAGMLYENLNYILFSTFGNQHLTLLMYYRECFGETGLLDFLIKIDNLFSVLWLMDSRAMQIQTRMFIIMRRIDELLKNHNDKVQAANELLGDNVLNYDYQDEKAATAVDINKFYAMLDQEDWGSFSGTRINKTRYLLLKLDVITGSDKMKLSFNKSVASVEHLMPQKADQKNWPIKPEFHKQWLHKLGNIVLIDKRKNSAFSNSSYGIKRTKFKELYLESRPNTTYTFDKYSSWDETSIQNNHSRAVNLLRAYYAGNSLKTFKELNKKPL
jgi:hypothetical protein